MKEEHFTDLGNTRRLVRMHGADLRYCVERRSWHAWDGKRWAPDATGEVMRRAKATVGEMYREAADLLEVAAGYTEDRENAVKAATALIEYALKCEAKYKLEASVKLAETELPIVVNLQDLDSEPWLLNAQNGTLDLRTGELRSHRRKDLITRICPSDYDPAARDPHWDTFLEQTLPDEGVRSYVQRALGYSASGSGAEGGIFLPFGPTHTGKTTLLEAAKAALGTYAVTMDVSTLTGKRPNAGAPRSDLVRLFGSRLVVSTEVPAGVKLDESLIKQLTGGDTLTARALYKAEDETLPTFVIWLGSNYRPAVRDDDDAVWERVRQVPFQEQHLGGARDKTLRPYLQNKARPAVLAWLVAGARAYLAEGLEAPKAVVSLTADYRLEMNPLATWISECCDVNLEASTSYQILRASYEDFTRRGDRPVGSRRFLNSLEAIPGVTYDRPGRKWYGVRVVEGEMALVQP